VHSKRVNITHVILWGSVFRELWRADIKARPAGGDQKYPNKLNQA